MGEVSQASVHSLSLITSSGHQLGPVGEGGATTTFASTTASLRQVQGGERREVDDKNICFSEDCQYLNTYIDGISVTLGEAFNLDKKRKGQFGGS